jgi:hypothetical protein
MNGLIWLVPALVALAILLRAHKRRDGIDWRSRGLLALLSVTICVLFDMWLHAWLLNATEEAAALALPPPAGLAAWIADHYQSILLPVYVALLAVVIDLLSRLLARSQAPTAPQIDRNSLWQMLAANLLVFVATPSLLYGWTATFASSGSIISDAAREIVMPVIATYGAPAYWLIDHSPDKPWRPSAPQWAWSPQYSEDSIVDRYTFIHDAAPWMAFAIVLTLINALLGKTRTPHRFIDWFVTPTTGSAGGLLRRIALGPWRGRAILFFTTAWLGGAVLWCTLLVLLMSLAYWLLGLAALAVVAALGWLISVLLRKSTS